MTDLIKHARFLSNRDLRTKSGVRIIDHDKTMGERLVIDKTVKVSISLLVLNPCSSPTDVSDF